MASSDLEQYMEANHLIDAASAINQISEANNFDINSLVIVVDEASEFILDTLSEAGIITERAAEADSTNLKRVTRWYNKFIKASRSASDSAAEIRDRIDVLKKCVQTMEKAKRDAKNGKIGDRVMYALKDFIPFNNIYRLIKLQDAYAGLGILSNLVIPSSSIVVRIASYSLMLEQQIEKTNEAIEFLERKLKQLEGK